MGNTSEPIDSDESADATIHNGGSGDDGEDRPECVDTSFFYFGWLCILVTILFSLIHAMLQSEKRLLIENKQKKMIYQHEKHEFDVAKSNPKDNFPDLPKIDAERIHARLFQAARVLAEQTAQFNADFMDIGATGSFDRANVVCPDWIGPLILFLLQKFFEFARLYI